MNLYEFTFIAQQSLLQQEVEGMVQELGVLLKDIKVDVIFHQVKRILEKENENFIKEDLELYIKNVQENLVSYSNFLENFIRALWTELEEDLSNLKEVKLKIGKESKNDLKNLEIAQDFMKFLESRKQIVKSTFIHNVVNALKSDIFKHLARIFQESSQNFMIVWPNQLSKTVEILLNNIIASGLIKYEYWGLLDFAYPINKMKSGHYCIMCISSTSSIIDEFVRKIKLNENIIRYLSVHVDKFFEGKSYMMNKQIEEQSV